MCPIHPASAPLNDGIPGAIVDRAGLVPVRAAGGPKTPSILWRLGVPASVLLYTFLAYLPALQAGFVNWDDDRLLFANTRYQQLTGESLRWMFTTSYAGHFQPLTWLSYAIDYQVWGRNAFGFHLTSVLIHLATTAAFYFVARRLLAIGAGAAPGAVSTPLVLSAALAAALFAVHPLRAESVAWVAERRDVLSGLFFVLAVASYLRFAGPDQDPRRHRLAYAGAIIAGALSLLAKATAMTLPLVLLVLDIYPLRRLGGTKPRGRCPGDRVWAEKIPFLLLSLAAGGRALVAQEEGGGLYRFADHDLLARLAQVCYGLVFYVRKTVWPDDLGPLYEIPPREVLLGTMLWGSASCLLILILIIAGTRRRWPALAASAATYALVLSPVLGIAQSGPQLVADRYSYLSCMGFAVLGGALFLHGCNPKSWWMAGRRPAVLTLLVAGVLVTLFHLTTSQNEIWRDSLKLWVRGIRISPDSAVANVNLADALAARQLYADAKSHYQRGLELSPNDPVAHHHLADVYRALGQTELAIRHYLLALRIDPERPRACYSLAELFVATGRGDLAVGVLRDSAQRSPDETKNIDYLARILASHPDAGVRDGPEALTWAEHVVRVRGNEDVPSLITLATAQAENGRFEEAIDTAERALALAERAAADALIARLRRHLTLFRQHQPVRM